MVALDADLDLRPVAIGDGAALARAYLRNRAHLAPWEPVREEVFFTPEWQERDVQRCLTDASAGRGSRFVLASADGEIRGRVNLNNIVRGAFRNADLGYWIDGSLQGRGLTTLAVAVVLAHARGDLGIHRVQAGTLTHNLASQRVLRENGFERIGLAVRYLEIAGEWQDHILFQRLLEDPVIVPEERP